jgi:hypothetical protein
MCRGHAPGNARKIPRWRVEGVDAVDRPAIVRIAGGAIAVIAI